jgi:hypothetical protein
VRLFQVRILKASNWGAVQLAVLCTRFLPPSRGEAPKTTKVISSVCYMCNRPEVKSCMFGAEGSRSDTKPTKEAGGKAPTLSMAVETDRARFGSRNIQLLASNGCESDSRKISPSLCMLRNSASGPEIGLPGRILAGLLPGKHRNRPPSRPPANRRTDVGAFRGRFPARKRYCVT